MTETPKPALLWKGMSEEQLAALVTRDAMGGVAKVTLPPSGGRA